VCIDVILGILRNQRLGGTTLGAALLEINPIVADDDLRLDQRETGRTGGGGLFEVVLAASPGSAALQESSHLIIGIFGDLCPRRPAVRTMFQMKPAIGAQDAASLQLAPTFVTGCFFVSKESVRSVPPGPCPLTAGAFHRGSSFKCFEGRRF